jgi:hypothetical protein
MMYYSTLTQILAAYRQALDEGLDRIIVPSKRLPEVE